MYYRPFLQWVSAIQVFPHTTCEEIYAWAGIPYEVGQEPKPEPFTFSEGAVYVSGQKASLLDWLVKDAKGRILVFSPKVFEAVFTPAQKTFLQVVEESDMAEEQKEYWREVCKQEGIAE